MAVQRGVRLPIYMVPIMLGLCGILFASRLEDSPILKFSILLLSVGGPMFAVGMLLAGLSANRFERVSLIIGVLLLALGALVTIAEFSSTMDQITDFSQVTLNAYRWLGISSLVVGLFAIVFILARREEAIEEVAERFRYLANHMSEGFILTSADGTVTLVNDALLQMTGLEYSDLIGKDGRKLAMFYELEPMLRHLDQRPKGIASEYHVTWRRNGIERQLWVNGTPLFDSRGRFTGALATVRDVTEQHQMSKRLERYTQGLQELVESQTEKLHQSRQRLSDLLFHMNEAFVTVNEAYRVKFANQRFCELIGEPEDNVVGRDLFEFIEPAARGRLLDLFAAPAPDRQSHASHELPLRGKDGVEVAVVVSIASIEPSPDAEDRYSLVMTDIRELKRMQHQLELRAAELEQVNAELRMLDRAKDNFLSTVTHELRTPLSTIRGYVEMLESEGLGELTAQQQNALKVMTRNIERLGTLIDEIIEFSRMAVQGISLHLTLLSSRRLLHECAQSMEPQLNARDIHLTVNASPEAELIWGDRRRLVQILSILLSNAVKFCNPGDMVKLSVERRVGSTVAVSVADTGIGIDPVVQKRVFDKFYQADSSLSRRYEGAGIGLSIAKTIAEAHGGHIDLQSEPGHGSTFTVILPQACFLPADPDSRNAVGDSRHVLVCVAELEFASALRSTLSDRGFTVTVASSGLACVREFKQKRPDVVVLDDVLPDLDGLATLRRLQSEISDELSPVVLMAGTEPARRSEESIDNERVHVLFKPFSADELVDTIGRSIDLPLAENGDAASKPSRRAVASVVVTISQDEDLTEWVSAALRARKIRCVPAAGVSEAQAVVSHMTPRAIIVEPGSAYAGAEEVYRGARLMAEQLGVPLVVLSTGDPVALYTHEGRILRLPCSTRELMVALSISTPVVA